MAQDLLKLQNGSDIRGIALEGIPGEEVNLNEEIAGRIGGAFAYWLGFKVNKNPYDLRIAIGYDPRLSAEELRVGLMKGITMFGAEPYDAGLASTPAMFMSTILPQLDFDGAIMITASHLPWNRNGFKFFTKEGGLNKEEITDILKRAQKYTFIGDYYEDRKIPVMPMYAAYLRQMISLGLRDVPGGLSGMHIIVDAGNGAGGFFATEVLEKMGADISGSQFLEPDGHFPNHQPNPESEDAMKSICKAAADNNADLGIIFDTDVDRIAAVGPGGRPVTRNEIIAMAAALAAEDYPGGTVVTDSLTSNELHDFLENKLGLMHLRFKRGYRNVIGKAAELRNAGENAFLAIETSGHAAYSDNYFLDDGAFLAVQIIINAAKLRAQGKTIMSLIDGLASPAESRELRFDLSSADDHLELGAAILEGMVKWIEETEGLNMEVPNYEGVRVNYEIEGARGWFVLRKSLHDPVMPLNIESEQEGGIDRILPLILDYIGRYEGVTIPQ